MIAIVCLDDNQGMLFNKRRQSRDAKVLENIWTMTEQLWISAFSEKLFMDYQERVRVDDDFLLKASGGEYCFVENQKLAPYIDKIEQLIVYKWNRNYPADFKLDINYDNWKMIMQEEFVGTSHDKITKEIYTRG